VTLLSRYDRSKHEARTVTSYQNVCQKKGPSQLFGRPLIRKSVCEERRGLKRFIAFKFFEYFFLFFKTEN